MQYLINHKNNINARTFFSVKLYKSSSSIFSIFEKLVITTETSGFSQQNWQKLFSRDEGGLKSRLHVEITAPIVSLMTEILLVE